VAGVQRAKDSNTFEAAFHNSDTFALPNHSSEDLEVPSPKYAAANPPRSASYYAKSLGDAMFAPLNGSSTGLPMPPCMKDSARGLMGRSGSGLDSSAVASSTAGVLIR
jgi:hypothetical protein